MERDVVARTLPEVGGFLCFRTICGGAKMRNPTDDMRRIKKSVSLPAAVIRAIEERAKRERRSFSSYVTEALELLDAGRGREVRRDQH